MEERRGSGGFGWLLLETRKREDGVVSGEVVTGKRGKSRGFWSCRSLAGIWGGGGRKVNE